VISLKRKFIYTFLSLIILGLLFVLPAFAVNTTGDAQTNNPETSNNEASANESANNTTSGSSLNFETPTEEEQEDGYSVNMGGASSSGEEDSATPSSSSYEPSAKISTTTDEFGINSILDLILVVVGILLVLLAIAILIRLGGK